jgi:hypothetical protein
VPAGDVIKKKRRMKRKLFSIIDTWGLSKGKIGHSIKKLVSWV